MRKSGNWIGQKGSDERFDNFIEIGYFLYIFGGEMVSTEVEKHRLHTERLSARKKGGT